MSDHPLIETNWGLMRLKVPNFPPALQKSIDDAVRMSLEGGM